MGLVDILHPLIKKLVEAVFPCPRSEVQLRNDYIHPPFFQPFPDIGKQLAVIVVYICRRAYGKDHAGFGIYDNLLNVLYHYIHIVSSEFLNTLKLVFAIFLIFRIIIHAFAFFQRRVEIIIHMDAVYIVFGYDFFDDIHNTGLHFGHGGVVDADFVIVLSPRYRNFGVKFSKRTILACPCRDAVRIHPGMKLESPFVGLLYKETQNIIARIFSGSTGYVLTPRLILRLVKGIRHSAYLEEYSIHVIGNQQIQIIRIFLLLSSGIVIFHRPVNAPYGSDPCTAQFFLG